MAEYFKFRLTAAKIGVSMAFFALLAGLAEKVKSSPSVTAEPAASFLAQTPAEGSAQAASLKVSLGSLEHKLSTAYYTTHKINQTFLKIKSANTEFLKIKSANTSFLKIDDANANFLKIDAANSEFEHGNGHVFTGAISSLATSNTPTQLVSLPGGIIVVSIANTVGAGLQLVIHNATDAALAAVADNGTSVSEHNLPAVQDTSLPVTFAGGAGQLQIQIFPSGQALAEVVTIIISVENGSGPLSVVGQAFTGGV